MRVEPRPGDYVSIFCQKEDDPFGAGWRRVLVIEAGRKWIRLIEPATLLAAKVTRAQFVAMTPRPIPNVRLTSVARRIRARRALFRRTGGMSLPERWIKEALAVLTRRPEARP